MDLLKFGRLRLLSVICGVLIVAAGSVLYREVPTILCKMYDSNVAILSGEHLARARKLRMRLRIRNKEADKGETQSLCQNDNPIDPHIFSIFRMN